MEKNTKIILLNALFLIMYIWILFPIIELVESWYKFPVIATLFILWLVSAFLTLKNLEL